VSAECGEREVCAAIGVSRSTLRRRRRGPTSPPPKPRTERRNPRRLTDAERSAILALLGSEEYVDLSVPQVHTKLLDAGIYLCSMSTMYRLLRAEAAVCERRRIAQHPAYVKPELLATGPRQLLSWDITKIRGPQRGVWFSLLVMIDVFSRFVVGWQLVRRASGEIATKFIREVLDREGIEPGQAVVHSDRGTEMTAQVLCTLLDTLGVERSLSRPRVSDDNPYSEAQFKTLKYHRDFPDRFGSFEDALSFFRGFFEWYNYEHRHSGIAMLPPAAVHENRAQTILDSRHAVMQTAHATHPERFVHGPPKRVALPTEVWINRPNTNEAAA
jgi:transposase InsO family protein